jgi:hypothetical protein
MPKLAHEAESSRLWRCGEVDQTRQLGADAPIIIHNMNY